MEKNIDKKKEEIKEPKKDIMTKIMFRQNRKFDLHIGRNVLTFFGREIKEIPKTWIEHKDFQNIKKYFVFLKSANIGKKIIRISTT